MFTNLSALFFSIYYRLARFAIQAPLLIDWGKIAIRQENNTQFKLRQHLQDQLCLGNTNFHL